MESSLLPLDLLPPFLLFSTCKNVQKAPENSHATFPDVGTSPFDGPTQIVMFANTKVPDRWKGRLYDSTTVILKGSTIIPLYSSKKEKRATTVILFVKRWIQHFHEISKISHKSVLDVNYRYGAQTVSNEGTIFE